MQNNIIPNTPEWLEAKLPKVGSSDIFCLVNHYCQKELGQASINTEDEKSFSTPLEIYIRCKFGIKQDTISEVNSEFGLKMEDYIIYRLNQENENLVTQKSNDFIVWDKNDKMCCTPDSYVKIKEGTKIEDYDKKTIIDSSWGKGIRELKTADYGFNFNSEEGTRWSYIFQLQEQLLVSGLKWGSLDVLAPKEKSYDTDFFKGKVLGRLEADNSYKKDVLDCEHPFDEDYINDAVLNKIDDYYNLYHYIYPENKTIQNLCILALKRFQKALDDNILPDLSIDCLDRLTRERKLLAILKPEKYGLINAREDEELNGLINDLKAASTEQLKIKTEMEASKCELIQKMDNHIGIEGLDWTCKFAKDGSLRFSKTKLAK